MFSLAPVDFPDHLFVSPCSQPLPLLPQQGWTKLDKLKRENREKEWFSLQKEADHLRRAPHKPQDVVDELEDYVLRLRCLAVEPQNCIPDVVIWMLSGNKRKACKRIPSHLLMYSSIAKARGKLCGKVQTLFLDVRLLFIVLIVLLFIYIHVCVLYVSSVPLSDC